MQSREVLWRLLFAMHFACRANTKITNVSGVVNQILRLSNCVNCWVLKLQPCERFYRMRFAMDMGQKYQTTGLIQVDDATGGSIKFLLQRR